MEVVRTVGERVGSTGIALSLAGAFFCLASLEGLRRAEKYGRKDIDSTFIENPVEKNGIGSVARGEGLHGLGVTLYPI